MTSDNDDDNIFRFTDDPDAEPDEALRTFVYEIDSHEEWHSIELVSHDIYRIFNKHRLPVPKAIAVMAHVMASMIVDKIGAHPKAAAHNLYAFACMTWSFVQQIVHAEATGNRTKLDEDEEGDSGSQTKH